MPPVRHPGFVEELCTALAHRWEPEQLIVILTAFLDESGTHQGSTVTVMAGYMASADKWQKFESDLSRIQKKYGFTVFHAKEFKAHKGKFSGWSAKKSTSLIDDLIALVGKHLIGVTHPIEETRYKAEWDNGKKPRRMRLDSRYGLCFRGCLDYLADEALKRRPRSKVRPHVLYVVLEAGHKNAGDAERIFNETRIVRRRRGEDILGAIAFADKQACAPLMVADFLAHTSYMLEISGTKSVPIGNSGKGVKEKSAFTRLEYPPGALQQMKDNFELQLQRRREHWRGNKD